MFCQAQVGDDLRQEQAAIQGAGVDRVRRGRWLRWQLPPPSRLRRSKTSEPSALAFSEVSRGGQAVVPAADDEGVVGVLAAHGWLPHAFQSLRISTQPAAPEAPEMPPPGCVARAAQVVVPSTGVRSSAPRPGRRPHGRTTARDRLSSPWKMLPFRQPELDRSQVPGA